MATLANAVEKTIVQALVPTIYEVGYQMDPFYSMTVRSTQGVRKGIGQGWNVLKTWAVGSAGAAKFHSPDGSNVLSTPKSSVAYDTPQVFQSLDEVAAPAFLRASIKLVEQLGNFYIPRQILQSDQLDASIGSVFAQNMKRLGRMLTEHETAVWYSTDPTNFAVADLGDTSDTVSNVSGNTSAVNINLAGTSASGRTHRFQNGNRIDIYSSDGATKRNLGFDLVIDNVDHLNNTIRVLRLDGSEFQTTTTLNGGVTFAGAGADNDIIVWKDSIGYSPGTMESYIADGTSVASWLGSINVNDFSEFRSYLVSGVGTISESVLNKKIAKFLDSFPTAPLTDAVTTMGVLIALIDNLDGYNSGNANSGRFRYDRNGKALDVVLGWDDFEYHFAGRRINITTSARCQSGNMYLGKFKGGLMKYVPPATPGAKADSRLGMEVEWVGPMGGTGYQGIFGPAFYNGRYTNFLQAPFIRRWVCCPEFPNMMKMTGITEVIG